MTGVEEPEFNENNPIWPLFRSEFGISNRYTSVLMFKTRKALDFILNPFIDLIWNWFPKSIAYSATSEVASLRSLLISTVVILEVTESWLWSITLRNLLYLNLAPYLFNSEDSAYFVTSLCTFVDTNDALGAKLVL